MLPLEHVIISFAPTLYLINNNSILFGIVFFLSNLLIDVDHYLLIVFKTKFKVLDLKKIYGFYKKLSDNVHIDTIFVFHTLEFILLLYLIFYITKFELILAVILGLLFHIFTDYFEVLYMKIIGKNAKFKQTSLIYYFIKKILKKRDKII